MSFRAGIEISTVPFELIIKYHKWAIDSQEKKLLDMRKLKEEKEFMNSLKVESQPPIPINKEHPDWRLL